MRRSLLIYLITAVAAAGSALPAFAQGKKAPVSEWPALITRLEKAAVNSDVAELKAVRTACQRLVPAPPAGVTAAKARYCVGYADYRLSTHAAIAPAERQGFAKEAETELREASKADPKFADAFALLSAVMPAGPEAAEEMTHAIALDPDNPRVLLIRGAALLRRPDTYGGDPKRAEALLRKAGELLDAQPANAPWPNWGRFDVHILLGQALAKRGDAAGAKAEYTKALKIAPQSSYLKDLLSAKPR
jgi:tetratricopeptide (TPR) repeat protein